MVMGTTGNLAQIMAGASQTVISAIQNASQKTGVDFGFLVQKAQTESSLNPNAKAQTSSATGLYQFVDKTWLGLVKAHGSECGLGQMASAINSDCTVSDPTTRQQILNLRTNPTVSAYMAAAATKDNQQELEQTTDGKVGKTELYLAHFLGTSGASKFLNAYESNPNTPAASVLPNAADANESVFYSKDGTALSVKQIYDRFASKFNETSPVFNTASAQTLPASPALSASAMQNIQNINSINGANAIAAIGNLNSNINIPAAGTGTICSNAAITAATNDLQQKTTQQQLAYLTQVAMETLQSTSPALLLDTPKSASAQSI